mmetsp:Transcript_4756/g.11997  ORF Transcript_4756/g.11997 Transcript_4756/m.11997 type:complete len:212 (-) Transcript_4756:320-955(-)
MVLEENLVELAMGASGKLQAHQGTRVQPVCIIVVALILVVHSHLLDNQAVGEQRVDDFDAVRIPQELQEKAVQEAVHGPIRCLWSQRLQLFKQTLPVSQVDLADDAENLKVFLQALALRFHSADDNGSIFLLLLFGGVLFACHHFARVAHYLLLDIVADDVDEYRRDLAGRVAARSRDLAGSHAADSISACARARRASTRARASTKAAAAA